jgi:hypothetical protein
MTQANDMVFERIRDLYETLLRHDGFGEMRVEMRILKRGQKEIIVCGERQYRYTVDFDPAESEGRRSSEAGPQSPVRDDARPSSARKLTGEPDTAENEKGGDQQGRDDSHG